MKKLLLITAISLTLAGTANAGQHRHNKRHFKNDKEVTVIKKVKKNKKNGTEITKTIKKVKKDKDFSRNHKKWFRKMRRKHAKTMKKHDRHYRHHDKHTKNIYISTDYDNDIGYLFAKSFINVLEHGIITSMNDGGNTLYIINH